MKLAIISESPADDAAMRILVEAVLGMGADWSDFPRIELRRGWSHVERLIPPAIKHFYYNTDVDGLIILADANGSTLHTENHAAAEAESDDCRVCSLRAIADQTFRQFRSRRERTPLRVAIAIAPPAIEAWYLAGIDPHATEAAWIRERQADTSAPVYIRGLKSTVYGTEYPTLPIETEKATQAARRLVNDLSIIESAFPVSFAGFAAHMRAWVSEAKQ